MTNVKIKFINLKYELEYIKLMSIIYCGIIRMLKHSVYCLFNAV